MDKELDAKLRETLGLDPDADIIKAVSELNEEVGPLREVAKQFSERKKFAEMFPAEAKELEAARKERLEASAIKFSETVGEMRFGTDKSQQFSQLVLGKVADTHKKFSEGTATVEDFEEVLTSLNDDKALVDAKEHGSNKVDLEGYKFTENSNPRIAFSEAVKVTMAEDSLDYEAAIKITAEKYPELAKAYFGTTVRA